MEIEYKSLAGIKASMVDECWDKLKPYVIKAMVKTGADNYWSIEDIYSEIKSRDCQLWAIIDDDKLIGAVVTRILMFPKCKAFHVWFVAADNMNTFDDTVGTLKKYGKSLGCNKFMGSGRKGWTRVFKEKPKYEVNWTIPL